MTNTEICQLGKEVIHTELATVTELGSKIDENFALACREILACKGRVIVIGIGKSGHIAHKIAATLASTGTPAFFVHPAEASHGDLGMITVNDLVITISNSGTTAEIIAILPLIKQLQIPLISICSRENSVLAKVATINLNTHATKEACPLGLAPTSSTTASLVMGDALAIALLKIRGFTKHDFALAHPGGTLGKQLLLKVEQLMHSGDNIPRVGEQDSLKNALIEITAKKLGMTTVVDTNNHLVGIFTDGDLRRTLDNNLDINGTKISAVMTNKCKTIDSDMLAFDALKLMEEFKITSLVVVNKKNNIAGIIHVHDILRAGIAG